MRGLPFVIDGHQQLSFRRCTSLQPGALPGCLADSSIHGLGRGKARVVMRDGHIEVDMATYHCDYGMVNLSAGGSALLQTGEDSLTWSKPLVMPSAAAKHGSWRTLSQAAVPTVPAAGQASYVMTSRETSACRPAPRLHHEVLMTRPVLVQAVCVTLPPVSADGPPLDVRLTASAVAAQLPCLRLSLLPLAVVHNCTPFDLAVVAPQVRF